MTPEQQALANMSQEDRAILASAQQKQAARFESLGIGNIQERQQQIQQTQGYPVGGTAKSLDVLNSINAIKSGQMKGEIDQFMKAENPNNFQAIPVNTPRNPADDARRASIVAESEQAGLGALKQDKNSREAAGIESMFDFDGGGGYSDVVMGNGHTPYAQANGQTPSQPPAGNLIGENFSAPSFDDVWASKRAAINQGQGGGGFNPPAQPAQQLPQHLQETQQRMNANAGGIDMNALMGTVEAMASKIADEKIRNVLSEYSSSFNGSSAAEQRAAMKNTFKRVKGHDDVIKIGEQYFRLSEVRFKKKS